jgi:hypothetical protein
LATCKPGIRREAVLGDWVIATGIDGNVGSGHLVYAMQVEEIMPYDYYYRDSRFAKKIVSNPDESPECRGDNMYFLDHTGRWRRDPLSFRHAELRRVRKDLYGENVLISRDNFWYFGRKAVLLPHEFGGLIYHGSGDTSGLHEGEGVTLFVSWLRQTSPPGKIGEPCEFINREIYGKVPDELPEDLKSVYGRSLGEPGIIV